MDTEQSKAGTARKKRKKWVIIAIVILLAILVGGALAYSAAKNKTNGSAGSPDKSGSSATHPFDASPNRNQSLIVTTTSTISGRDITSTVQSDGHGNYNYLFDLQGKPMTTIYTTDGFYQCKGTVQAVQSCVKYPYDPTQSNVDPSGPTFDSAKIKELKGTVKYSGQKKCPDAKSTCDVWVATTKYDTTTYYYVDTASKQIMQTIHYGRFSEDKNSTKVTIKNTYTYKYVHVTVPTNYTDAPKPQ
ncbi:MAG TPA: hypothetical protein VLG47_04670 [Candidatus Saccharimonadales bacterium]|nr:hypothetical protein [Candidatus Saccharimonadales bacterium]